MDADPLGEALDEPPGFDDLERTADWLEQTPGAIETAPGYYRSHRDEIDRWISGNEEAAEAAERVALARRAAA